MLVVVVVVPLVQPSHAVETPYSRLGRPMIPRTMLAVGDAVNPLAVSICSTGPFSYNGGPILSNAVVYVVFWGSDWLTSPNTQSSVYNGLLQVINGGYLDSLDQYGYGTIRVLGQTVNPVPLTDGQVIPDQSFLNYAASLINLGTIPKYQSLVMFILPPNKNVSGSGHTRSDAQGYHFYGVNPQDPKSIIAYSVIQTGLPLLLEIFRLDPQIVAIMHTVTHELVEAITDPAVNAWSTYASVSNCAGEIGDLCDNDVANIGIGGIGLGVFSAYINGYAVEKYWSKTAGKCVAGGGNGLTPVSLSVSGIPSDQCPTIQWTTNLAAFSQAFCGSQVWTVRGSPGSALSLSPTILNAGPGTRYSLSGTNSWAVTSPVSVAANYIRQFLLNVNSQFGTTSGGGWYNDGSTVSVSISQPLVDGSPGTRYAFTGWSGDASGTGSTTNPILMNSPKTTLANWKTQYFFTANSPYGTVSGTGWYDSGTSATASLSSTTVDTGHGTRYVFTGWTGDASGSSASSNPLTMDRPKTASASWKTQYFLDLKSNMAINVPGGGWQDGGTQIRLIPPTADCCIFKNWIVDGTSIQVTQLQITMDRPHTVLANYQAKSTSTTTTTFSSTTATTSTTSTGPIVPRRLCLIATASFGSPLAPEVSLLRSFRDDVVMVNALGSQFMIAFDAWYYSFSPQSASILQTNDEARDLMRAILIPTIAIVRAGTAIGDSIQVSTYSLLASGFAIAALLGTAYLSPALFVTGRKRSSAILKQSALVVGASVIILLPSNVSGWTILTEISSVLYITSSVILGAAVTAYGIRCLLRL